MGTSKFPFLRKLFNGCFSAADYLDDPIVSFLRNVKAPAMQAIAGASFFIYLQHAASFALCIFYFSTKLHRR